MSPTEPTERVIVYDGHCYLCSGWARFLERHPPARPFQLVPMQSPAGRSLLEQHGIDPDDPSTFLVLDGERVLIAGDAALHIIAALGGAWRLVDIARIVPRPARDALYRWMARNRYRWFGRRPTCYVPMNHAPTLLADDGANRKLP
jgi:predicted DCC family thiol-disulfide oxidoreductase YuxK